MPNGVRGIATEVAMSRHPTLRESMNVYVEGRDGLGFQT